MRSCGYCKNLDTENGVCIKGYWVLNRVGAECLERLRRKAHTPALFGKDDKRAIWDDLEGIINKHSEQSGRGMYGF